MLSFSGYINDKTFSWTAHVLKYLLIIWKLFHYGSAGDTYFEFTINSLHRVKLWMTKLLSTFLGDRGWGPFNKKTEHLVQQLWLSISIFYHYSFTLYLCCSLYWYSILCNNVIDIIILLLPLATATLWRLRREKGERDTIYNDNIFISMFVVGKRMLPGSVVLAADRFTFLWYEDLQG